MKETYYSVKEDSKNGKVEKNFLKHKQRAVFLDRDGTINCYVGFLTDINEMELLEGAAKAIRLLNLSGYLVIVVTNQSVIARRMVSLERMREIHNKMETLLKIKGAYVDDIFFCPHHPNIGYSSEYKIVCKCRKPEPGMLLEAAQKYNIDLNESWMIGDSDNDMEAGRRAGCKVAYIGTEKKKRIPSYPNLLSCVKAILDMEKADEE